MARKRARGQNEGSIFQRKDGRWVGQLSLGWKNGRRERTYFYGNTASSVQDQMTAAKEKRRRGIPVKDDSRTVARLLDDWLASIKSSVRTRTYEKYQDTVRIHLKPSVGRLKIEKLMPQDVQKLLDEKLAGGLHPRTVQSVKQVLSYALNEAVRWQLLSRNVAMLVKGPKIPQREMNVWNEEQARKFLETCTGKPLDALYTVALFTGLRRGEILALRWSDLELDAGMLMVRRNMQRTRSRGIVFEEPKTKKGRRSINLAPPVIAALRAHRKRQLETRLACGPEWKDQDLVFCTGLGTPLDPRTLALDYERMIEKSKLPRITFHSLRHTFATIGLTKNVNPKVMADMLGHSKVSVTLDVYSHALPNLQAEAAGRIAQALISSTTIAIPFLAPLVASRPISML